MKETLHFDTGTRLVGCLWLLVAPVLVGMALISTVQSETTYWVQIVAFSVIAVVGAVAGIATGLRYRWGARVLLILSWLGFAYFVFCGLLGATYSVAAGSSLLIGAFHAGLLGVPGLVFASMAVALRSGLRSSENPPNQSFGAYRRRRSA